MQIYITEDGIRLNTKLDDPLEKQEKNPLVIVIHGFTGNMEERHIVALSQMFNRIGCTTLRVDMYGHGQSDGSFEKHTLYKWLTNALTVIDFAKKLNGVSEIYLCGHSQGGLTVLLAAAMKHEIIKGIILMSPAFIIPDGARKGYLLDCSFDPERIPDRIVSDRGFVLDGNYFRVAQTIHVEDAIKKFRGPVCLVHGEKDKTVPVQCSIKVHDSCSNAELTILPDDTHCYDYHLDKAAAAVEKWMKNQLSGGLI